MARFSAVFYRFIAVYDVVCLDLGKEEIIQDYILMNLGNVGSKSIFDLTDQKQKMLINKIFETRM